MADDQKTQIKLSSEDQKKLLKRIRELEEDPAWQDMDEETLTAQEEEVAERLQNLIKKSQAPEEGMDTNWAKIQARIQGDQPSNVVSIAKKNPAPHQKKKTPAAAYMALVSIAAVTLLMVMTQKPPTDPVMDPNQAVFKNTQKTATLSCDFGLRGPKGNIPSNVDGTAFFGQGLQTLALMGSCEKPAWAHLQINYGEGRQKILTNLKIAPGRKLAPLTPQDQLTSFVNLAEGGAPQSFVILITLKNVQNHASVKIQVNSESFGGEKVEWSHQYQIGEQP